VVVYGPIALVSGTTGEVLRNFALVIVVAMLGSLLVSFTLTPMLAAHWLGQAERRPRFGGIVALRDGMWSWIVARYGWLLSHVTHRAWLAIVAAPAMLGGAILLVPSVGAEFVPDQNGATWPGQARRPE
jgi:HAE1 family hydrophobic/amphiphilic exporter-1